MDKKHKHDYVKITKESASKIELLLMQWIENNVENLEDLDEIVALCPNGWSINLKHGIFEWRRKI